MYAVIRTGGKQYRVAPNDVLSIEKLAAAPGAGVSFDDVLMIGGATPVFGAPTVPGARVTATVVEQTRADVIVDKDGAVRFKADGNERTVPLAQLGHTAKDWLKDQPEDTPVLISADKTASYDSVMKAMSELQRAGVARVALAVKSGG